MLTLDNGIFLSIWQFINRNDVWQAIGVAALLWLIFKLIESVVSPLEKLVEASSETNKHLDKLLEILEDELTYKGSKSSLSFRHDLLDALKHTGDMVESVNNVRSLIEEQLSYKANIVSFRSAIIEALKDVEKAAGGK